MPHGDKGRLRERFIACLLTEPTIYAAASKTGLSHDTATRWMRQPVFQAAYMEARQRALDDALRYLQTSLALAVGQLRQLIVAAESETVRLGAAKAVVELSLKSWEMDQLMNRLTKLEEHLTLKGNL